MNDNRSNKYGSFLVSAMVVLVSALAADAQPLIPIDQRRNIDTFAFLPQCGQQGSDQEAAVGFTPFNGLVQTVLGCPAASLDGFAEQQSQIGVASMSANGVAQSNVVASGPDTIISLQNSSFEVTFQLSALSRLVSTGQLVANTTNALIGAGSSAVITLRNEANDIVFQQVAVHAGGPNALMIDEFDVLPPGEYVLSAGASSVIDDAVMGVFLSRATYDIAVDVAVLGDIDDDGDADFDDVDALVAVLLGMPLDPAHVARADLNNDGSADGLDIPLCLEALLFVPPPPPPPPGPTVNTVSYAPGPIVSNCLFSFTVATVQGAGFDPAVTARLTQPGRPDIPASGIVFTNASFFEAVFGDLSGIATGLWQLEVANPGTAITVAQDGLTVVQCP